MYVYYVHLILSSMSKNSNYFSFGISVMKAEVRHGKVATLQNFALLYFWRTEPI